VLPFFAAERAFNCFVSSEVASLALLFILYIPALEEIEPLLVPD